MSVADPVQYAEDLQLPTTRIDNAVAQIEAALDDAIAAGGKIYSVTLSQTSTSAPAATILKNTLGGVPVWARTSAGLYTCTLASAFPTDKVLILLGASGGNITATVAFDIFASEHTNTSVLTLTSRQWAAGTVSMSDNLLLNTEFHVVVYP